MELLQSLLSNLWAVFLVVFFFGGSIFVHELGHFLAARKRGLVVERFSIGMGPPLFRWKGKDGVEYWLSWLPLGSYVKLPQLADLGAIEGASGVDYSRLPQPTYTTKILVFGAGAVFNLIFAFFLACVLWWIGMPTPDDAETTQVGSVAPTLDLGNGKTVPSPAARGGLQPGDIILSVDDRSVEDWSELRQALVLGAGRTDDGSDREVKLTIRRGDETREVVLNPVLAGDDDRKMRVVGITSAHRALIQNVTPNSPAASYGLQAKDEIVKMDGQRVYSFLHLASYLDSHFAAPVQLEVMRNGQATTLTLPPRAADAEPLKGIMRGGEIRLARDNPFKQMRRVFESTIASLSSLVNPRSDVGVADMSGPIGIVMRFWDAATSDYPIRVVVWFTLLINISLAIFNLLPIPVLDGGHILFATIGKLRGKALPADFINAAQSVFMILLFSMVVYVSFWDVRREIRTERPDSVKETPPALPEPAPTKP